MTNKQMPEALRLAAMIKRYNAGVHSQAIAEDYAAAAFELERQHAEIERLRAVIELVNSTKAKRWHPCDPVKHAISDALQSTKEQQ